MQDRLETIYADFNYTFTQDPNLARQLAQATGGALVTLKFDEGPAGGAASELDFDNRDLRGTATIDVAELMGNLPGLVAVTSANVVGLSACRPTSRPTSWAISRACDIPTPSDRSAPAFIRAQTRRR